jgi:hypothetical protein
MNKKTVLIFTGGLAGFSTKYAHFGVKGDSVNDSPCCVGYAGSDCYYVDYRDEVHYAQGQELSALLARLDLELISATGLICETFEQAFAVPVEVAIEADLKSVAKNPESASPSDQARLQYLVREVSLSLDTRDLPDWLVAELNGKTLGKIAKQDGLWSAKPLAHGQKMRHGLDCIESAVIYLLFPEPKDVEPEEEFIYSA